MPQRLFCCVDGGGSRTRVALFDEDGNRLGFALAGPTSLTLVGARAWDVIVATLRQVCSVAGPPADDIQHIHFGIGLAGANSAAQRTAFIEAAPVVGALHVATDAYIAALGAHIGGPGAIVIVGTGSVGYRIEADGGTRTIGGWGFPAGDEGSGAWLGRAALAQSIHVLENRFQEQPSEMHKALIARCGPSRDAMLDWLRDANATRYAELAPLVLDYAGREDPAALRLATAAGAEVEALAVALDPGRQIPLSLVGGLAEPLVPYLPEALRQWKREPHDEPIAGALMLAQGKAPGESFAEGGD